MTRPVEFYEFRVPVKRTRPSWWTPEGVLERLQSGQRVVDVCRQAASEMAEPVSVSRLRTDISQWAGSLTWGEQFQAAYRLVKTESDGKSSVPVISKDWYDDFYDELRQQGGKIPAACEAQGIGVDLVYALRDKRNKCYDAEFDEQVRILEGARIAKIRENVLNQAEAADSDGAKIGVKVLESHMPSLHGQKAHLEISGGLTNKVEHHFIPPEVVAASQARTRALLVNRERKAIAAPRNDEQVIDLVPEAVKESA